jgi:hypothetical protein
MKKYNKVISAATPGIVAILFGALAFAMPTFDVFYLAPGFFPLLVSGFMLILSAIKVVQEIQVVHPKHNARQFVSGNERAYVDTVQSIIQEQLQQPTSTESTNQRKIWWIKTFYIIGTIAAYVAMMWYRIPFMLSTALYLSLTLFIFAKKRWISNTILIVVISVGLYYLFSRMFFVMLPS